MIEIFDLEGHLLHLVTKRNEGTFTVPGLAPGSYEVRGLAGRGRRYWHANGPLAVGEGGEIHLVMAPQEATDERRP